MADGPDFPHGEASPQDPAPHQTQPDASADSQSPAPQQPTHRPAYGEMAPEGWQWAPEGDATPGAQSPTGTPASPAAPAPAQPGQVGVQGSRTPGAAAAPTLPGVPHNLGAGLPKGARSKAGRAAGAPHSPQGTSTQGSGTQAGASAPYRAAEPAAPTKAAVAPVGAPRPRTADRIITIALLVIGAYSTLTLTQSMFALASQIRLTGTMIGVDDLSLASWVGPLGTITGFAVLALFAVTLIFSIQRMRAGKLTFWVPLTAGAIAVLIILIVPTVAMLAGAPEILHQLEADPNGSVDKMMAYIQEMQL